MRLPQLSTDRLILRPASPALAKYTLEFYRRNARSLQEVEPTFPEDFLTPGFQRSMLRQDRQNAARGVGLRYWAFLRDDPEKIVGCAALNNIVWGAMRSGFIAYKIDRDLRGQGFGSELVNALTVLAFRGLGLHRLQADIMPRNAASLALARRCGFHEEGRSPAYIRINGAWEEHIHMVKLNEEER